METQNRFDVLIIGSGVAGLAAAIESKTSNNRVLVIEKLSSSGGNSIISDGGIGVVGSDLQSKFNLSDSTDLLVEDMLKAGNYKNNPVLVRTIAENSNAAYEWTKEIGVIYQDRVDFFGGHSIPRCLTTENKKGKDIIVAFYKYAQNLGVEFCFKTEVKDIIIRNDKAKSIITYNKDKGEIQFLINHKLIVATGGFGSDQNLIKKYSEELAKLKSTNLPSAKGDMLHLMEKKGANLVDMQEIQCGPWASPDEKGFGLGPLFADYIALPYGILINPLSSKRFVNERADRKEVSDALMKMPYGLAMADQKMVKRSGWDITKLIEKNIVVKFDSLEAIANMFSMNQSELIKTIKDYNHYIKTEKKDEFNKNLEELTPLEELPFYIMKTVPKVHHTMGGIEINEEARVIKKDRSLFRNIYAAGECTGGIHGSSRLGSMALTDCLVMGRIAGSSKRLKK